MGPKKPSGSTFKKAREARNKAGKKLAQSLGRWLNHRESVPGTSTELELIQEEEQVVQKDDANTHGYKEYEKENTEEQEERTDEENTHGHDDDEEEKIEEQEEQKEEGNAYNDGHDDDVTFDIVEKVVVAEIVYDDPCKWPNVTDAVRVELVERGPHTVDIDSFKFPTSDDDRHLSQKWFFKELPNGERVRRQWMLYSKSKDAVFCFPCILFEKKCKSLGTFSDTSLGFNDWKHLNPHIKFHENSEIHRNNYVQWKELEVRLKKNNCLDAEFQRCVQTEKEKWREILRVIVDVVMYCAKNNLPLRGSSDSIGDQNCGVFLSTLELISHYHPLLKQHISDIKSKKNATSYFSPTIQNEIIDLLGNKVRAQILNKVKSAKYFSIIFDCTPDVSHSEQMSEVLRYVDISNGECKIVESFVDFTVSHNKTGEGISQEILCKLKEDGLEIKDCRGQGFDNGSNMAGIYNGVQAHISRANDLARFVPCAAHSLNLVGVHAAEVSPMMVTFFGVIQNMFCFFSGSTLRWEFLKPYIGTTLKGHSDTRWSSKRQAITSVEKNLKGLFTALQSMTANHKDWNKETVFGASVIIKHIDFKFVCLLHMWSGILVSIDCTNKLLQQKDISLDTGSHLLNGLSKKITKMREDGIDEVINKAVNTCDDIGIKSTWEDDKRIKRKKTLDSEMAGDESYLLSAKQAFQRECFCVFDKLTTEMADRSKAYHTISTDFQFLDGSSLKNWPTLRLENCAKDFGLKYHDVDTYELVKEISTFKFQTNELIKDIASSTHLDLLKAIHFYKLQDAYPNIEICLRIFLTMPVTVASCERSFSKLKLIKNYLRSRTGQSRLTSLAILSIEHQTAASLSFDDLIDEFASVKARRSKM